MAGKPIKIFPDPCLRQRSEAVRLFDAALTRLYVSLLQTMKAQKHGIGIAAPQIGVLKRLAVVDVSSRNPEALCYALVNPILLWTEEPFISKEGCMSIPDYTGLLQRYRRVRVRWQDLSGVFHEKDAEGIEAVCIQHEIDHLDGKIFVDRITSLKRHLIVRKQKKAVRENSSQS